MVDELFDNPKRWRHGIQLHTDTHGRQSLAKTLEDAFADIKDVLQTNKVRVIDAMTYASDATAIAAWVASNAVATSGIAVSRNTTQYVEGTSSVLFTTGTSTYTADVTVTKTLSPDSTTYLEDGDSKGFGQNWAPYNYLGFPYYAGEAHDAADVDIILTDADGNTATYSFPAVTTNYVTVYNYLDVAFSDFTESGAFNWERVKYIAFMFDDGMGTSETLTVDQIAIYKFSNGHGPAHGNLIKGMLTEASVARGMLAKFDPTYGVLHGYKSANAADEEVVGIFCSDGDAGDTCFIQISGMALVEVGESPASWEVCDGLAAGNNSGYTVVNAAATMADAFASYVCPIAGSVAQYSLAWIRIGNPGGTPSA